MIKVMCVPFSLYCLIGNPLAGAFLLLVFLLLQDDGGCGGQQNSGGADSQRGLTTALGRLGITLSGDLNRGRFGGGGLGGGRLDGLVGAPLHLGVFSRGDVAVLEAATGGHVARDVEVQNVA